MHIAFLTGHSPKSKRKTGFHFWAEIASSHGDRVSWITLGQSHLTIFKQPDTMPKGSRNRWHDNAPNIQSYLWVPPIHPVKAGPLTKILAPLFSRIYSASIPSDMIDGIADADIIVIETGAGLLLTERIARACKKAKLIYYCSDRLETLGAHPSIVAAEKSALPYFSLVRTNASSRLADFPSHPNVRYIPQGIDKALFDRDYPNPYQSPNNIISVGDMLFDGITVSKMAQELPSWNFHLFGRRSELDAALPNVFEYGERSYDDIVPYLKHADIGLAPYRYDTESAYLTQSSLKIVQYTYCLLPIVAPSFISSTPHIKRYNPNDLNSLKQAVADASDHDKTTIDRRNIPDWTDVYKKMLEAVQ